MPKISALSSMRPIKAIVAAQSGRGKTGMLWSLAAAGFQLKVYDTDNGYPIIESAVRGAITDPVKADDVLDRIEVCSFTNKMKPSGGTALPRPDGSADAWPRLLKAMNRWPDSPKGTSEGPNTWGPDTVLVIDSLTMLGRACLLYSQVVSGTTGQKADWTDFGNAQAQIESIFALLYGDSVRCHVLWLTHVKNQTDDKGKFIAAFPATVGSALNEVIPRYVNNILSIKQSGLGNDARRWLSVKPTDNGISTKTERLDVKDEYLLTKGGEGAPGLAEFFTDMGWPGPSIAKPTLKVAK